MRRSIEVLCYLASVCPFGVLAIDRRMEIIECYIGVHIDFSATGCSGSSHIIAACRRVFHSMSRLQCGGFLAIRQHRALESQYRLCVPANSLPNSPSSSLCVCTLRLPGGCALRRPAERIKVKNTEHDLQTQKAAACLRTEHKNRRVLQFRERRVSLFLFMS